MQVASLSFLEEGFDGKTEDSETEDEPAGECGGEGLNEHNVLPRFLASKFWITKKNK